MRMSSEMFPFASHAKYGYNLAFANKELKVSLHLASHPFNNRLTFRMGLLHRLREILPRNLDID